ncbi:MAG: hypothetical protein LLG42_07800 [Chloroflexi bacterium]|nr:hypothetical protein [Chloroflexota bacterium]
MRKQTIPLVILLLFTFILVQGCASTTTATSVETGSDTQVPATELDGATLVQERCTVCHSISRVENKKASLDGWRQTVERMISSGAVLSSDEKEIVIEYLAATYPE